MPPFGRPYTTFCWFAIVCSSIWYRFWVIWHWVISWPWNLGLRSLKVIQTGTIRKFGCDFLFAFHSNYGSILHHLPAKDRYWSKIVIFSYPLALGAPVRRSLSEYRHPVWCGYIRMVGLPDGEKTLKMCLTVCTQYRRVTGGQTDGQTDGHLATA